jgi:hypothetical protein
MMRARKTSYLLFGALGLLGAAGTWLAWRPTNVSATPVASATEAEPPPAAPAPASANVDAKPAEPTTATIVISTTPSVPASVFWGKKLLGRIAPGKPLIVKRPLDSGPLDLMVKAQGYLPVQTRAHTFWDHRLVVKLTPPENKRELLGYRAPLEESVDPTDEAALSAVAAPGEGVQAQGSTP